MTLRKTLRIVLILITLSIPLIQLSIGFYYINSPNLCPIQHDIMLLMSIGGVFQLIFLAAAFAFVFSITPSRFKGDRKLTDAEVSVEENNRLMELLIGCITFIFGACAMIYFVLLQVRIYGNFKKVQTKSSTQPNYCLFTIFYSAFGLILANYVAILLFSVVAVISLFGIGLQ